MYYTYVLYVKLILQKMLKQKATPQNELSVLSFHVNFLV